MFATQPTVEGGACSESWGQGGISNIQKSSRFRLAILKLSVIIGLETPQLLQASTLNSSPYFQSKPSRKELGWKIVTKLSSNSSMS
jgi:hypothetical protein